MKKKNKNKNKNKSFIEKLSKFLNKNGFGILKYNNDLDRVVNKDYTVELLLCKKLSTKN